MPGAKKAKTGKSVETLRHEDASRTNIPTAEYQSMVRQEEESSIQVAYERRNRDLDPQLVWRGKDEQDESDLVVNAPCALHPGEGAPQGADSRPDTPVQREPGTCGASDRYVR